MVSYFQSEKGYFYKVTKDKKVRISEDVYKRNIICKTPNIDKIKTLYKELEINRVRGWIMIRALSMIK